MENTKTSITLLIIAFGLLSLQPSLAQVEDSDYLFLQIGNAAEANGMGRAGLTLVNQSSALYNPGALGLFHLDRNFGLSAPKKTKWLSALAEDLWVSSSSVSIGTNLSKILPSHNLPFEVSFGLGLSKQKIDYGNITRTDDNGSPLGTFSASENADIYTFAIGLKKGVEIGIGYNLIKVKSHLSDFGAGTEVVDSKADASDFGLIVRLPLGEIFSEQLSFKLPLLGRLQPIMTLSSAEVTTKIDQLPTFSDSDPELKKKTSGVSAKLGLKTGRASLISANFVEETEDHNVDITKSGHELGIAGTYFIRTGSYDDPVGRVTHDTEGWGFSLRGPIDLALEAKLFGEPKGLLKFILERIDFRIDHAEYPDDPGLSLANTEFTTWSISL